MRDTTLETIKSRGYWRVNARPLALAASVSLGECRDLVERHAVSFRGWSYPHFPRRVGEDAGLDPGASFYEGWVDWAHHIELWRMYESTQFIDYLALREDWATERGWRTDKYAIKPMTLLGVTGLVYQVTEIYHFIARLAASGIYRDGVELVVELHNTKGRKLWIEDPLRADFFEERKTGAETIRWEKAHTKEELLQQPTKLALKAILYVCDRFGWHSPSIQTIEQDQDNLIHRRL